MKKINLLKTKKGDAFLPIFVVVTLVVFTTLAYNIYVNNAEREKEIPIGLQVNSLINNYNEIARAQFFLDKSSQFAEVYAFGILGDNGGFYTENSCSKIEKSLTQDALIILDSKCGLFSPEDSFKRILESRLNEYVQNYRSLYPQVKLDDETFWQLRNWLPGEKLNEPTFVKYTGQAELRYITIEDVKSAGNDTIITFKPIKYPIEYSTDDSILEHQYKVKLPKVNFNDYQNLYSALALCKSKPDQSCENFIKSEFPGAIISNDNNLIKINTNTTFPIKLAFNPSLVLPQNKVAVFSENSQ
jgi:hypothetical protein